MGLLTREQILGNHLASELVDVPEWAVNGDMQVRVRALSLGDVLDLIERAGEENFARWFRRHPEEVCVQCVVDDAGARMFTLVDAPRLRDMNGEAIRRITDTCSRLSGLTKSPEDIAKN
jgi:hypothetical protein